MSEREAARLPWGRRRCQHPQWCEDCREWRDAAEKLAEELRDEMRGCRICCHNRTRVPPLVRCSKHADANAALADFDRLAGCVEEERDG